MKFSVTGKESGASDIPFILQVRDQWLCPFGITPNDKLTSHRAALDGVYQNNATGIMKAGNYFEDAARQWFMDDYSADVSHPDQGYRNPHCNLVASLDGLFAEDWEYEGTVIPAGSIWECKIPTRPGKPTDSMERILQVQAQLDCCDAEYGVIAELARLDCVWRIAIVKRHEATILAIREAVNVFWQHMEDDTDYGPVTSSEYSRMLLGNPMAEAHNMIDGPENGLDQEQYIDLKDAADTYISAQRAKKASESMMESSALMIKAIMGGMEKIKLPDGVTVGHTTTEYKARPEKVTPAKPAWSGRRLSVKQKEKKND